MPWNRKSLLTAAELLLRNPGTTLVLRKLPEPGPTAHVASDEGPEGSRINVTITLDPARGGIVEAALHEALHIVLDREIGGKFNQALEEVLIKALERDLWAGPLKGPTFRRWRRLIRKKLQETGRT